MSDTDPDTNRDSTMIDEEAEVRDALLDHPDDRDGAWIFAQLDAAERRAAEGRD